MSITLLEKIKSDAIKGIPASVDDCIRLAGCVPLNNGEFLDAEAQRNLDAICDAADEVRRALEGDTIDTCSIVNGALHRELQVVFAGGFPPYRVP
jgi:hypothetical protein